MSLVLVFIHNRHESRSPAAADSAEAARANDGVVGCGNGIEAKRTIRS